MLGATVWIGGHWAVASSCFLGVRALLIQDDWANDREGVSGMAAAIVGGSFAGLHAGRRAALPVSAGCFAAGFTLHYAHRWCAPHPSRLGAVCAAFLMLAFQLSPAPAPHGWSRWLRVRLRYDMNVRSK